MRLRQETQPDEIYNLAAQSHVQSPSGPGTPPMPIRSARCCC
nr:hypothetical protein [Mesorhizobium sanjuanii]